MGIFFNAKEYLGSGENDPSDNFFDTVPFDRCFMEKILLKKLKIWYWGTPDFNQQYLFPYSARGNLSERYEGF